MCPGEHVLYEIFNNMHGFIPQYGMASVEGKVQEAVRWLLPLMVHDNVSIISCSGKVEGFSP